MFTHDINVVFPTLSSPSNKTLTICWSIASAHFDSFKFQEVDAKNELHATKRESTYSRCLHTVPAYYVGTGGSGYR